MTPFVNPWKDLDKDALHKTTVEISREVFSKITRVHSKQGVLQTTIYLLITKLANELERNGLTDWDQAGYEHAVAGCTITLDLARRSPVVGATAEQLDNSAAEAVGGNDGPGDTRLARPPQGHASTSNVDVAPRKSSKRRVRTKDKSGTSETQESK